MRTVLRETLWWIRKAPVTTGIVLVALAVGIAMNALWVPAPSSGLADTYGWGLPAFARGEWWTLLVGAFIAPAPWMYLLILPLIAVGGGFLEYKYGAWRMLAALFVTHVASVLIVGLIIYLLAPLGVGWAVRLVDVRDGGLSNAGFGAIGAMTAALAPSWRRRARTGLFLYALVMVLYVGFIWDLTHLVALLVGFAVGPLVVKRPYARFSYALTTQEKRVLVAQIVVFNIITLVVTYLVPQGGLLESSDTYQRDAGSTVVVFGLSIFLGLLAYGTYAGRKIAWRLLLTLTILLFLIGLILAETPAGVFGVFVNAVLLVLLVVFRRVFTIKGDRVVRSGIYKRLAALALGLFMLNAVAIFAMRAQFSPEPDFGMAVVESIWLIFGGSSLDFVPQTPAASFLTQGIGYVWGFALLGGIGALVFTTLRDRDGRGQFAEYDRLLHEHGSTSIGWMARWPGMSYWVDPARTAGFAYRLENNIAIVLSDPVGSPDAVATSLGGFTEMCDRRGWRPVFYSVTESFRALAAQHGYQAIVVGEDTVIDLPDLAFTGKSWQSVRTAVNQAGKLGISMRPIRYAEATAGMRVQLQAIAASWSDDKSLPPLGFTLGTLAEASDPEVIMHVAVDAEGTVHGMTSWMPVYGQGTVDGWTLDIMQRGLFEDTMRGVVEFLIAESAMAFKQEGYRFISLSASPLSRGEGQTGPIEALLDMVAKRLEPLYGFQSLHSFKAKFKPRFEPMYLCYRDEAQLPAISIAIIKAYLPDNALRGVVASKIK